PQKELAIKDLIAEGATLSASIKDKFTWSKALHIPSTLGALEITEAQLVGDQKRAISTVVFLQSLLTAYARHFAGTADLGPSTTETSNAEWNPDAPPGDEPDSSTVDFPDSTFGGDGAESSRGPTTEPSTSDDRGQHAVGQASNGRAYMPNLDCESL